VIPEEHGSYTVGVLVQANHGWRQRLSVAGVPVGQLIGTDVVPDPYDDLPDTAAGAGSIIVIVATDAPLLPHQCRRIAQRASLGIARTGGAGEHSSGDILLAFSTATQSLPPSDTEDDTEPVTVPITMYVDSHIVHLYHATIEATEAAIVNALLAAETTTGRNGATAYGLEPELLLEAMRRFGGTP
jgi:D-aminopeptidase